MGVSQNTGPQGNLGTSRHHKQRIEVGFKESRGIIFINPLPWISMVHWLPCEKVGASAFEPKRIHRGFGLALEPKLGSFGSSWGLCLAEGEF